MLVHLVGLLQTGIHAEVHLLELEPRSLLDILPLGLLLTHGEVRERGKEAVLEHQVCEDFRGLQLSKHLQVVRFFAALLELHQNQTERSKLFELHQAVVDPLIHQGVLLDQQTHFVWLFAKLNHHLLELVAVKAPEHALLQRGASASHQHFEDPHADFQGQCLGCGQEESVSIALMLV